MKSLASRLVVIGVVQMLLLAITAVVIFIAEGPHEAARPEEHIVPSLIQHLESLGIVAANLSCAHSIWIEDADVEIFARRGATPVHNPASNLRIGSGLARVKEWLLAGVNVALGTDGSASNDGQNMFDAMRLAALIHNQPGTDFKHWVTPAQALAMATRNGARAFGLEAGILALSVFCASHVGETLRGALIAIPPTQLDAARSIGLTFPKMLLFVLLPQALRQIAPNFVNTAVEIVKASSLLSAIGVAELLLTTQEIVGRTFMTMEFYALAGALYLAVNLTIGAGGWWVERRFRAR